MTMDVLQNRAQIEQARAELQRRGLSALDSRLRRMLRRAGFNAGQSVGEQAKSWDVLKTVEFIEEHVPKSGAILDIGAFASEILSVLRRLGYRNLAGVDLNPELRDGPHADVIRYEVANFMETPFASGSFDAITAISVIEHGFQSERLLREMARLLRPGGFFIASVDYWPEKIDTRGQTFFGLDWLIFSEPEVRAFVEQGRQHGFAPAGQMRYEATQKPIECAGHQYTFGWFALEKSAQP